jgi:DNA-binding GntR family transcriptional regulator
MLQQVVLRWRNMRSRADKDGEWSRAIATAPRTSATGQATDPHQSPNEPNSGRLSRRSLRDGAYDSVLEMLLSGRLVPGESLRIDTIARNLGVSPSPVREALAQVEHTGMIIRTPLRGYTVAEPISPYQMDELLEARTLVEVEAVKHLFPVSDDLVTTLRRTHADHLRAAHKVLTAVHTGTARLDWATTRAYYEADHAFHLTLLENCGNRYLLGFFQSLAPHVHRFRQILTSGRDDIEYATKEHGCILAALEAGDPDEAILAMREHMDSVRRRSVADASSPH